MTCEPPSASVSGAEGLAGPCCLTGSARPLIVDHPSELSDFQRGVRAAVENLGARVGGFAAVAAVTSGIRMAETFMLHRAITMLVRSDVVELFDALQIGTADSDLAGFDAAVARAAEQVDWHRLAREAGEPVDLPDWQEFLSARAAALSASEPQAH